MVSVCWASKNCRVVTWSCHLRAMEYHAFRNFVTFGDFSERTLGKCEGIQKLVSIIWVFNSCLPNWVLENCVFFLGGGVMFCDVPSFVALPAVRQFVNELFLNLRNNNVCFQGKNS